MKIGILSDTHGQVDLALVAAREFLFRGTEAVFHCGDIGSDMVLTEMDALFQEIDIPLYVVLGNCDLQLDFSLPLRNTGIKLLGRFGDVRLDGRRIALLHSDDEARFEFTVHSGFYDYVLFGHSHVRRNERVNQTRLINPGSAGRGLHPSCAVLDFAEDTVTFLPIYRNP